MEEQKTAISRVTRSRRASVESPAVGTPKKNTRSAKLKNIDENAAPNATSRNNGDDLDDNASVASSDSMKSCKVILRREKFDDSNAVERSVAHSTRLRRSSHLTEENMAAHSNPPSAGPHSLRSGSIASDGTESTTRTRASTRLANSQNTPRKETITSRVMTPSRRSSRLLSENEKTADSPAKATPGKRNLRSMSVASEDISPPTRRTTTRLADSQSATPKSLKTKVSKIKSESNTPRRSSMRINKSAIATDIIDEEPSDEEDNETVIDKSKQSDKLKPNLMEDEQTEIYIPTTKDGQLMISAEDEPKMIINVPVPEDVKPVLTEAQKANEIVTSLKDLLKSPNDSEAIELPIYQSPVVLVTTTTVKTPVNTSVCKAQTSSVEPVEPIETSTLEPSDIIATPKQTSLVTTKRTPKGMPNSAYSTPQGNIQKTPSNNLDSTDVTVPSNASSSSLAKNKSTIDLDADKEDLVNATDTNTEMDNSVSEEPVSTNVSVNMSKILDDVEQMDIEEIASETDSVQENLKEYRNKALESVEFSVMSTPKHKSRVSNTFESMDVSVLTHDTDDTSTPQPTKKSSHRKSINDSEQQSPDETVQSSVIDETEVVSKYDDQEKMATPKLKRTPKKENTPQQVIETSQNETITNVIDMEESIQETSDGESNRSQTESHKLNRPPRHSSFGGMSISLNEEINKLIAGLETPSSNKEVERRFNEISEARKSADDQEIDCRIDEIAAQTVESNVTAQVSNNDLPRDNKQLLSLTKINTISTIEDKQNKPDPSKVELQTVSSVKRKSVQIMTPKMNKIQTTQKRFDTPYPDEKSISEATANHLNSEDEKKKKREVIHASARENLRKLRSSWTKTVIRNAFSNDLSMPTISSRVTDSNSAKEAPAKKSVPARNNWSRKLVDSESEPEEVELILISEDASDDGSDEDMEKSENEFIDDEAEEVENYQSGDSMDEEEKREIEDNEIEEGLDIGSSDTEYEYDDEENEYEEDGFIVGDNILQTESDESEALEENSESDEDIVRKKPQRKAVRVLESSSSEESDDGSLISASTNNDVVSVSVQQVQSVVVFNGNPPNEDEILEGKTFTTNYMMPENEKSAKKSDLPEEKDKQIDNIAQPVQKEDLPSSDQKDDEYTEEQEDKTSEASPETLAGETELMQKTIASPAARLDGKENQSSRQKTFEKIRSSLPGIQRLIKSSTTKKSSRVSLGDLNPNAQTMTVAQLKTQVTKKIRIEAPTAQDKLSDSSSDGMSSHSPEKVALDISSQEENNNQKTSSIKGKTVEEKQVEEATGQNTVSSTSSENDGEAERSNISKGKRKFVELDLEEPRERQKPKYLKIINSASGQFIEEPMTPEKKNKFGFREAPRTPVNSNFKIERRIMLANRTNKRKSVYLNVDEDDVRDMFLPRPKWQINTQFDDYHQPTKRSRKLELGATQVMLQPAEPQRRKRAIQSIPLELRRYRHNILHRAGIPRQDSYTLLRERQKRLPRN